ncbi:MAG: N-acetylmuramoyl-L-alanine amidase [Planctomycetes bacterium]|nr:N-acetylmuramoyl-L-alanine amidase [Planctomycetota bacterium]
MNLRPKPVRGALLLAAVACLGWGLSLESPASRTAARAWVFTPAWEPGAGLPGEPPAVPRVTPVAPEPLPPCLEPVRTQVIRPRTREWKSIIVHHSAGIRGNAEEIGRLHREERGWDGLGYHFVIGNGNGAPLGGVEVGYRWLDQSHGAHAGTEEHNQFGIGICVVGNYEEAEFPEEAYVSLRELTSWLARRYAISPDRILPHSAVRPDPTACPGRNFPLERLRRDVEEDLRK